MKVLILAISFMFMSALSANAQSVTMTIYQIDTLKLCKTLKYVGCAKPKSGKETDEFLDNLESSRRIRASFPINGEIVRKAEGQARDFFINLEEFYKHIKRYGERSIRHETALFVFEADGIEIGNAELVYVAKDDEPKSSPVRGANKRFWTYVNLDRLTESRPTQFAFRASILGETDNIFRFVER